jgi:hypothetical protein
MSQYYIWRLEILFGKPEEKKPLGDLSVNGRPKLMSI